MSYSATRLTLYVMLAAIEEDLREMIRQHFPGDESQVEAILDPVVYQKAIDRATRDSGIKVEKPELDDLLPFFDFSDTYQLLNSGRISLPVDIARYLKGLTPDLDTLVPIRNRVAHQRPIHFDDLARVKDFSEQLLKSDII